jgi:co-chaperonin GroES (HSP10)
MEEKLLKTIYAEYVQAPYMGENKSGWKPWGDYILIRPDMIAKKTSGGVDLPDDLAERMQLAAITGVIVECGDEAFKWNADRTRRTEGCVPRAGDRVIFEKYAGKPIIGEDKNNYRIMEDKSVGGIQRK